MKLNILKNGVVKKDAKIAQKLIIGAIFLVVVSIVTIFVHKLVDTYIYNGKSVTHLQNEWKNGNYQKVSNVSSEILKTKPFHNTALIYHGYSAFFLAISDNDTVKAQTYLDEAIFNIRLALQNSKSRTIPQLEYMLGKAYYHKNSMSTYHYYADLAVLYLNMAVKHGYKNPEKDIPLYLGLSYASLGMTMESISAFTKALLTDETDLLLLSIAEQYYNAGQAVAAEQYLFRISQDCKDEKIINKTHLLLGKIYIEQKKYEDAEKEFTTILENNEISGDAYYGLGVIYDNMGDVVKARSYWRKALKAEPNHAESLKKLSEYK